MNRFTVSATGMRILRLLVGRPPVNLHELVEAAGVTRTAVTEQLGVLLAAGYLVRKVRRGGRGRPHHLYEATEEALHLFPTQERRFVPAMLEAVEELGGRELLRGVLLRIAEKLAGQYRGKVTSSDPVERVRQLVGALQDEGIPVEVTVGETEAIIRERSCPFVNMVGPNREACAVERNLFSQLLSLPVEADECRLDTCSGCTFRVVVRPATEPPPS